MVYARARAPTRAAATCIGQAETVLSELVPLAFHGSTILLVTTWRITPTFRARMQACAIRQQASVPATATSTDRRVNLWRVAEVSHRPAMRTADA